jgi:hypothetical protein
MTQELATSILLRNHEALEENVMMAMAGRILAVAAQDPRTDWSIPAMAKATGLMAWEVEAIFAQPWFLTQLHERSTMYAGRLVSAALQTFELLMKDGTTERTKLDAAKSVLSAYRALVECSPGHDQKSAEDTILEALNNLKPANATIRETKEQLADASNRTLGPSSQASQAAQDLFRHPHAGRAGSVVRDGNLEGGDGDSEGGDAGGW